MGAQYPPDPFYLLGFNVSALTFCPKQAHPLPLLVSSHPHPHLPLRVVLPPNLRMWVCLLREPHHPVVECPHQLVLLQIRNKPKNILFKLEETRFLQVYKYIKIRCQFNLKTTQKMKTKNIEKQLFQKLLITLPLLWHAQELASTNYYYLKTSLKCIISTTYPT